MAVLEVHTTDYDSEDEDDVPALQSGRLYLGSEVRNDPQAAQAAQACIHTLLSLILGGPRPSIGCPVRRGAPRPRGPPAPPRPPGPL